MTNRQYSLVFGLGLTGTSIVHYLSDKSKVLITDTRLSEDSKVRTRAEQLRQQYPSLNVVVPTKLSEHWSDIHTLYLSPGIPMTHHLVAEAVASRLTVKSDIDLFLDEIDSPVIAVTGTNGKSTVVSLTAELLKSRGFVPVGNIGTPALDVISKAHAGYVLELSSFQLERITNPRFTVATCLNITEDHMDHHESFQKYIESKHRIYENSEVAIFNGIDEITKPRAHENVLAINENPDWSVFGDGIVLAGHKVLTDELGLKGRHNHFNLVVAAASAYQLGMSVKEMLPILRTFQGLPHRLSDIGTFSGITFINDSKATNVGSTLAALRATRTYPKPLVLMLGGDSKAQKLSPLEHLVKKDVDHLVVYGRDQHRFSDFLSNYVPLSCAQDFEGAVKVAIDHAHRKGTVLLSPACASFDMFENFEDRGQTFCTLAKRLCNEKDQ